MAASSAIHHDVNADRHSWQAMMALFDEGTVAK